MKVGQHVPRLDHHAPHAGTDVLRADLFVRKMRSKKTVTKAGGPTGDKGQSDSANVAPVNEQ